MRTPPEDDDAPPRDYDGLGIAAGMAGFAILCVSVLPEYFDATGGWRLAWSVFGGVFGLIGLGGGLVELGKLWDIRGAGDLAVVIVVGGFAGVLHLAQASGEGAWTVVVRILVVGLVLIAAIGLGIAAARLGAAMGARERVKTQGGRAVAALSVATATLGLVTAVLNFMRAGTP